MIADIFTAVSASAFLAGVDQLIGGEFIEQHAAPPRMVWVPTNDSFRPGKIRTHTSASLPKSIGTRVAGVRVRIWGKGAGLGNVADSAGEVRAVEDLLRRLICAVHEKAFGSYNVESMNWVGQDGQELLQYGRCCDVSLSFEVPIYATNAEVSLGNATITTVTMTGQADFQPLGDSPSDNDEVGTPAP